MRLDKFLKVSRIIKRRTIANDACDMGRVKINEKPSRASAEVKVGDIIAIRFGDKWTKFEVLSIVQNTKKEASEEMAKVLTTENE